MALHHKLKCKEVLQETSNQLQDQNMANHEQFPVKHTMDFHKRFEENVSHRKHSINQSQQSI